MMTQELIHRGELATATRSLAPSTQIHLTVARMQPGRSRISIGAKGNRKPVESAKLREFPVRCCLPIAPTSHHWGIVLTGGDGFRLRDRKQIVGGTDRPRQFCPILGDHTLLEQTRQLAELSVLPEQIVYSVIQAHERYYRACLADRTAQTIVQPTNKGTAPAILSALLHIAHRDPNAIVAILPSDHSYSPENVFIDALRSAFEISEQRSGSVVILGLEPKSPEVDCGWIELGGKIRGHSGLAEVRGLQERPAVPVAIDLFKAGSLWNTSVMVGHVCTFLEMSWATVPDLLQALESPDVLPLTRGEIRIADAVYDQFTPTDFTRQVLCSATDRLLTLRLSNVEWTDLGDRYRELVMLVETTGDLPTWARLWPEATTRISTAAT